tara:strand:+ start:2127 stop:2447 length:321 start_codon:yes stop_codon:yes gene_type:complete
LNTEHDETRIVPSCDTNVIQIVESSAELRADQRIGWWIKLTSHAIWLEAEDTSGHKVHIVSPSGDDWVSVDGCARNSGGGETLLESLPGISEGNFLSFLTEAIANE